MHARQRDGHVGRAWLLTSGAAAGALLTGAVQAQVVVDGSTPTTVVSSGGGLDIVIDGGAVHGVNQFHSFSDFSVPAQASATFSNSGGAVIETIISRVTGDAPSLIEGALNSSVAGADLFFVNPNGVVFGAAASVDVAGALHISTADELVFDNGDRVAMNAAAATFSAAAPEAFGFLGAGVGDVAFVGAQLDHSGGLSVSANDIVLTDARLRVTDGPATLFAAGGASTIAVGGLDANAPANGAIGLDASTIVTRNVAGEAGAAADLRLRAAELELINGARVTTRSDNGARAGAIAIAANVVEVTDSRVDSGMEGVGDAGVITIDAADSLALVNAAVVTSDAAAGSPGTIRFAGSDTAALLINGSDVLAESSGGGGDDERPANVIVAGFGRIDITGGSTLSTSTSGAADAGVIAIRSPDAAVSIVEGSTLESGAAPEVGGVSADALGAPGGIVIEAADVVLSGSTIHTDAAGGPDAAGRGDIRITAANVSLLSNALVSANTTAAAGGDVRFVVEEEMTVDASTIEASTTGVGAAGSILVTAETLTMRGGEIKTETSGAGAGGLVRLDLSEGLAMNASRISASTHGIGAAGSIVVGPPREDAPSPDVELANGSRIVADAIKPNGEEDAPRGRSGAIDMRADELTLSGRSFFASRNASAGDGLDITVAARSATLSGGSYIRAGSNPGGSGASGDIRISVAEDITLSGGRITASTFAAGDAGTIDIEALGVIRLTDKARVTSSLPLESTGGGGQVSLRGREIIISDGAEVFSRTFGEEDGGRITIVAVGDVRVEDAEVGSNAYGAGRAGTIGIEAGGLVELVNGEISASTEGAGDAGTISVVADDLALGGGSRLATETSGVGAGGDIALHVADTLTIANAVVRSSTTGAGDAGDVVIGPEAGDGTGRVILASNARIVSDALPVGGGADPGLGAPGVIVIRVESLEANGGGLIATRNGGGHAGGGITVEARDARLAGARVRAGLQENATGEGGSVTFAIDRDLALDGSTISASTWGLGDGGVATIEVGGTLVLTNAAKITGAASAQSRGGDAGSVIVSAGEAEMAGGSKITSSADAVTARSGVVTVTITNGDLVLSGEDTLISAQSNDPENTAALFSAPGGLTRAAGDDASGSVVITAQNGSVILTDLAAITTESATDTPAGTVTITADALVISGGAAESPEDGVVLASRISSVASGGANNAGAITIDVGALDISDNGWITTNSANGEAGDIAISVSEEDVLFIDGGRITTTAENGLGAGGFIAIGSDDATPLTALVLRNGLIEALGAGDAAFLRVDAQGVVLDADSRIAVSGVVDAPDTVAVDEGDELSDDYYDAGEVLASACAAQRAGDASALAYEPNIGARADRLGRPNPIEAPALYADTAPANLAGAEVAARAAWRNGRCG